MARVIVSGEHRREWCATLYLKVGCADEVEIARKVSMDRSYAIACLSVAVVYGAQRYRALARESMLDAIDQAADWSREYYMRNERRDR